MSLILHTGFGALHPTVVQKLTASGFQSEEAGGEGSIERLASADLFLIGPYTDNPVKKVQEVTAGDKHISIILLALPEGFARVKQTLQFAPFVGRNALCLAYNEHLDLPATVQSAAARTRQRRSFSRINKVPKAATPISQKAVRVEHFGTFLQQAPIGALLLDEGGAVLAINQKATELFGAEGGKQYVLTDFFPGLTLPGLRLNGGERGVREMESGGRFLELNLSEVSDEEGKTLHILLVNDITEQKRKETALRESEALFRFMAESMPQKVWTADAAGRLNFFNGHWTAYTGKSAEELKGWGWLKSIHPEDAEENRHVWQEAIDTGQNFEFEQRIRQQDGAYRWHLVRGIARKDAGGKVLMWIGTNTDIHEQKAFAEELAKKVRERTFELENSNHELEQFVYVTSHDLQEPLRKVRMFTELARTGMGEGSTDVDRYLDKVSSTALRMSTLLKELLNFTQMSRQEQAVPTDLNDIVDRALVDLELLVSEKGAVVDRGHLPTLNAIPVQMHQLFYNLIGNALKFSKKGEPPLVSITAHTARPEVVESFPGLERGRKYCVIVVQDNGIGFDPAYAEQIFHVFHRLHNRTEYSGTGIGLALCKKVVANHYGTIYAQSQKGAGAAFHVLLPSD